MQLTNIEDVKAILPAEPESVEKTDTRERIQACLEAIWKEGGRPAQLTKEEWQQHLDNLACGVGM